MGQTLTSIFKRFFLICSFFVLFFSQSSVILAQNNDDSEEPKDFWGEIWDAIANLFDILSFTPVVKPIEPSFENTALDNQDYNNTKKDMTTRATSNTVNEYNKGIYLNDVLNNKFGYENKHLAYGCDNTCENSKINDNCIDITTKSLIYYYYTKNIKILYQPGTHTPLDYDPTKFSASDKIISNDDCYQNLYNNYSFVPQGSFQNKEDAAAGSSTQLNFALRTPVSANQQGDDIPQDNSIVDNTEKIVKDNDKQENTMLNNFIPEPNNSNTIANQYNSNQLLAQNLNLTDSNQNQASQNTNLSKEQRRQAFTDYLHPYNWQDNEDAPERDDLPDDAGGEYTGTCNAIKSHCRGMSQYGAYGMAKQGFQYQNILKFYYGDIELVPISTIQKPDGNIIGPNPEVKVDFVESNDCGGGSTLDLEDYLSGLGEMPDYWGKNSSGGFEALKAQVVAARTYALMKTKYFENKICNSSRCQVFRCSNLHKKPYLNKAIEATKGLVMVDIATKRPFSTEYARSFCGPSRQVIYKNIHTNPSVNGIEYEKSVRSDPFCK